MNILFFILGIGLFIYMLKDVGINFLWAKTKKMGWAILIPIFVTGFAYIFQGFAWWNCIDHSKSRAKLGRIIATQIAGRAFAEIAPFSSVAGEAFKGFVVKNHVNSSTIVSSLFLFNTIHTLVTITMLIFGVIISLILIKTTILFKIVSLSVIIGIFISVILFVKQQKKGMITSFLTLLMKINFFKKRLINKVEKAKEIDRELHNFWENKRKNYYLAYLFFWLTKLVGALEYFLILYLIGYPQSFLVVMFLYVISNVIFIIAFFIPSQMGVITGGLNRSFKVLGLDPEFGTILGIFRRIRVILWTAFGLLLIPLLGFKKKIEPIEMQNAIDEKK